MSDATTERFRAWLADNIWDADDFGGFVIGVNDEVKVMANVTELFDLLDPDWRLHTHGSASS